MPRLPVDGKKVIEHRVTLGSYEREQLDTFVTGVTVRNVGDPLVALLSDVTALTFILGFLELSGLMDLTDLDEWAISVADGLFATAQDAIDEGIATIDALTEDYETLKRKKAQMDSLPTRIWISLHLQIAKLGEHITA